MSLRHSSYDDEEVMSVTKLTKALVKKMTAKKGGARHKSQSLNLTRKSEEVFSRVQYNGLKGKPSVRYENVIEQKEESRATVTRK